MCHKTLQTNFHKKYLISSTNTTDTKIDTFHCKLEPWENLKNENQKRTACDGIAAEMIKHAPKTIDQTIENIFNNIVQTADVPRNYPKT